MKTYLLAVCGLAPQVITETLYALHQQGRTIDAIRVITTRSGKDACLSDLFRAGDGHYFRYLEDYDLDPETIEFLPRDVMAVLHEDGTEMEDISTEEDNERFLSACMKEVFELTRDADSRVLFSIAGGRKTMGACLSLAAQCYGRSQDRIYHVLVTPEFESCREFFYPPREPKVLNVFTRDRKPCAMSTAEAEIKLLPMPFFSLRKNLTPQMLRNPETPAALMLSLVREEKNELIINLASGKLIWKGEELDMSASRLSLYAFFAEHKKKGACERKTCRNCKECYLTFDQVSERQEYLNAIYSRMTSREIGKSGIGALEIYDFNSYRSKINKDLLSRFGEYETRQLQVESIGPRPGVRYGIPLGKSRIRIVF